MGSRVVYAAKDPGRDSSGGGEFLRQSGVEVVAGVCEAEAEEQGRIWLTANRLGRPFVTLKWASSLDGRSAASDGTSKWISGEKSRSDGHLRRSEVDAILVGTGTVLADDPELTARTAEGGYFQHQPLRVILGERELSDTLRVFNDTNSPKATAFSYKSEKTMSATRGRDLPPTFRWRGAIWC